MRLLLNTEAPQVMHIDLNSCFATVEQQARPMLRGRPVGVTNRRVKAAQYATIVAASYEAKQRGVKVGMRADQARLLAPDIVILETDPPKYHFAYQQLVNIMRSYSPQVTMKSIDEGIIDFHGTRAYINQRTLPDIALEIKQRLKQDVGCWMRCNIGIAPNRFLAKLAASLHKPDGLDVITHENLRQVLAGLRLTDLHGIARRNQARLNAVGIFTPLDFLDAPSELLRRQVFRSICGEDWYQRLRGHEVDDQVFDTKTIGRQYVLEDPRLDDETIDNRLAYLCETTGMKLRYKGLCARGVMVYARYLTGDYWYERKMFPTTFFSNAEVHRRAMLLFSQRPHHDYIREIGVTCYALEPSHQNQISLLDEVNREVWLTEAVDRINQHYGEFTVTFANSYGSRGVVKQKIPFGTTRYFELLCRQA
jgi:DNA polymerase-4